MSESLGFPLLDDPRTWMISACGELLTDDAVVLSKVSELGNSSKIYRVGDEKDSETIEVFGGSGRKRKGGEKHLHINVLRNRIYGEGKRPKINSSEAEISDILRGFFEQKVLVTLVGRFVVPPTALPERGVIRAAMVQADVGDLKIAQTGATFAITGNPVQKIQWFSTRNGKDFRVELTLEVETVSRSDYLKRLHALALGAFRSTILGETNHATS